MDDQESSPLSKPSAAEPMANSTGGASPMPSLITSPSTNLSFSPRTPGSPTYHAPPGFDADDSPTVQGKIDPSISPAARQPESSPSSPISRSASYASFSDKLASHDATHPGTVAQEIAKADLTIAENGSYIETTSAHAALELKRQYDKQLGVGKPGVRSPYAITTSQDAQGRAVYRIGSSRPGPSVAPSTAVPTSPPEAPSRSRRLRLSVGALLAPKSRPTPAAQATTLVPKPVSSIPRKPPARLVRTVRSTSELRPRANTGGSSRYKQSNVSSNSGALDDQNIMDRLGIDGDAFGVLIGWSDIDHDATSSSTGSEDSHGAEDGAQRPRRSDTPLLYPFGRGVHYTSPSRPLDLLVRRPSSPPQLRYVQSFESGLTARADDSDRHFPERLSLRPSTRMTSRTHQSASPYPTEVFEVLQTYKGLPMASHLADVPTETVRLSSTLSAAPKNDPRFVIWGTVREDEDDDELDNGSEVSSPVGDMNSRRRGASSASESSGAYGLTSPTSSASGSGIDLPQAPTRKVIVAATIERWIAQLTSELDYGELLDFFLTFRVYIQAIDLCQLLICRFHWALEGAPEGTGKTQDEIVKKIVRVRTFIAFRYWLSTFFQVDFLKNRELCKLLTTWLNSLKADEGLVGVNQDVLDIVRKLKKIVRECKEKWFRDAKSSAASTADSSEGSRFSENASERQEENVDVDADVDLEPAGEIGPNDASSMAPTARSAGLFPDSLSSPPRHSDVSASTISGGQPAAGPSASGISQLHDLQATILSQAKPALHLKANVAPSALPMHQSAISRALVNTMGKLGRWKRVLHARSAMPSAACNDPGAFDLEINSDSDREIGPGSGGGSGSTPRLPLTPNATRRGSAFHGGLDAYLRNVSRTPPANSRRMLGSGWSALSANRARGPAEEDDGVIEEIYREAAATEVDSSSTPPRRLVRTASAIPLNPQLLIPSEPGASDDPPMDVGQHSASSSEGQDVTPQPGSDSEPMSPPGLEIPAHLLHRPASSSSMRRISEYRSSPLKGSIALPEPVEESADVFDGVDGDQLVIPPTATSSAEMDAHHVDADDFEMDSLADDEEYRHGPEVVALDDYDLSSSDSASEAGDGPPRLRRTQRRLPTRRDFEFVRRSIDSVSSLGIRSSDAHSSVASGSGLSSRSRASRASHATRASQSGGFVYDGEILPWHLDLIEDSDDEQPQGAEAALARLEGQIDSSAQKEKLRKVDRWMRMVASRMAAGETIDFSQLLEEEEEASGSGTNTAVNPSANTSVTVEIPEVKSTGSSPPASVMIAASEPVTLVSVIVDSASNEDVNADAEEPPAPSPISPLDLHVTDLLHEQREALGAVTPTPTPAMMMPGRPMLLAPANPGSDNDEQDVPPSASTATNQMTFAAGDRRTSLATKRRGQHTSSLIRKADILLNGHGPGKPVGGPPMIMHRSFVLLHRSEALAEHFAMIQRELFLTIKFGEIVSWSWIKHEDKGEVLDWAGYIKERAKIKVEARTRGEEPKISDVAAIRARFNMVAAFTATDVVLSHPNERPAVFGKFLRVAWKSYLHNNFSTVVALITGLQHPAVSVAMKRIWSRVGTWEMRVFKDLKEFASPHDNFKLIREAIDAMVESRPLKSEEGPDTLSNSVSNMAAKGKVGDAKAPSELRCIPFIGVYLADLHRYRKLPDYIDPTSPSSLVTIHKKNGLSPPRYPEAFSTLTPLPASVPLEPLINVQKQRLTAGVVKNIVAGQHLASKLSFDLDRKLYQKCLRLKALPPDKLMEVAKTYGGEP